MNFFTYRISLDIRETTSQAFINVKKNDTARKFIFTLTDNGRAYQITEGCTAVFRAKKPDGTILYNNCPIVGNAMEYYLTSQTVAAVGIVECEITLYGSNSKQITSPRFSLAVDDVLYSDSEVESKDEFTALTGAIDEVRASKAFTINLTTTNDGITADKTFTEIAEKVNAAKSVIVNMDGWVFPVSYSADSGKIVFSSLWANIAEIPNTVTFAVNSSDVWNVVVSDIPTTAQVSAKYTKPASGIPKTDLAVAVQTSLDKADTALQTHQSLAAYRTALAQDVIDSDLGDRISAIENKEAGWNAKQDKLIAGENITIAADGKTISSTGGGGGGSAVELDTTLTQSGKAADAKAVGDAIGSLSEKIGAVPENVALLEDVTADEASGDFIPMLSQNGTEYRLSIGDDGVPVIKNANGATVWSGTSGGSSGGGDDPGGGGTDTTWTSGVPYTLTIIANEYVNKTNGTFVASTGWSRTDYTPCAGAARIVYAKNTYSSEYCAWYDINKNFISKFAISVSSAVNPVEIEVPADAAFFAMSTTSESMNAMTVTPYGA